MPVSFYYSRLCECLHPGECLDALNRNSPLIIALITLWKLVSEGRKAKRESLISEQNITVATRIAAAVEAIAKINNHKSLTVVEERPSIKRTPLASPVLPLRATGGVPLERCLPSLALPKGCLPPPALPNGVPLELFANTCYIGRFNQIVVQAVVYS